MRTAATCLMLFLSITLIFVSQPKIYAQDLDQVIIDVIDVDSQAFPEIRVVFALTDPYGTVIDTLKADDVLVTLDSDTILVPELTFNKGQRPVAAAIVLDTSTAMNDQSTPFRTRLKDANEKIEDLLRKLPPGSQVSLITFNSSSNLVFPSKADGGGLRNSLRSITLDTAMPNETSYDISNAIKLAIEELQPLDGYAKNIIVFAAGTPNADYPFSEIKDSLNAITTQKPRMTIIGLGSSQEGQFTQYPANPESLERLAQSLDANFAAISASTIDEVGSIMAKVETLFDQAIQNADAYALTVDVDSIGAGEHRLNLVIGNQNVEISFNIAESQVNSDIILHAPAILNETAVLSVTMGFTSNPITKVQYFLDNTLIYESTNAPDFNVSVDIEQLLESYTHDQPHTIFAAAIDAQQKSYRSSEKQIVLSPKADSMKISMPVIIGIVVVSVVVLGLIIFSILKMINKRRIDLSGSKSVSRIPPVSEGGGITSDYGGVTGDYTDHSGNISSKWVIEIREPNRNTRKYSLMNDSVVLVGRTYGSIKADISFDNDHISKTHAKITIKNNVCFIHDQGSKFGTFITSPGINNQRLDKIPTELQLGDVIILGKTGIELELQEA